MDFRTQTIHGRDAIAFLHEHREKHRETGEYPFLIGDERELQMLAESMEFHESSAEDYLREARTISVEAWFAKAKRNEQEDNAELDRSRLIGAWPSQQAGPEELNLSISRDTLTQKYLARLIVGLVRIEEPWHLPAAMKYGSWNSCPAPEEHCALHKFWQEKYGAEIVSMSHDTIECIVSNPPTTRDEAMWLAWEQYWYCNDVVDQGCETISELAATLLNSRSWYFWWD